MLKTIRGKLTVNIIGIVIAVIVVMSVGLVGVAAKKLMMQQKGELQLEADRYAQEVSTWFEEEKGFASGVAKSIEATGATNQTEVKKILNAYLGTKPEIVSLYMCTVDGKFYQAGEEFELPEGYDPSQRPWYQNAAN